MEMFNCCLDECQPQKWCCLVSKRLASNFIIFENRLLLRPPKFICLFLENTTQYYYLHSRVWNIFFEDNWRLRVITSHNISIVDKSLRTRYTFHKISAWGYEILADLSLDSMWVKINEALRYVLKFASHRQDFITRLSVFIYATEEWG